MNPSKTAVIFAVLWVGLLLLTVRPAFAQETTYNVILATDKDVYWFGGSVILHGRAYNLSYEPHDFQIFVDEYLGSGYWKNVYFDIFTAYAPEWNFEVKWIPIEPGNYSAYVVGPNHTLSRAVSFLVVPIPVPEFSGIAVVAFSALAASLYLLRRRGK